MLAVCCFWSIWIISINEMSRKKKQKCVADGHVQTISFTYGIPFHSLLTRSISFNTSPWTCSVLCFVLYMSAATCWHVIFQLWFIQMLLTLCSSYVIIFFLSKKCQHLKKTGDDKMNANKYSKFMMNSFLNSFNHILP